MRTTADYILAVANRMAFGDKTAISLEAIEAAAKSWARSPSKRNPRATFRRRRRAFRLAACSWLRFLGRMPQPPRVPGPCEHFVQEFAQYMAKERGFSPRTIAGYSWYVENFLNRLAAPTECRWPKMPYKKALPPQLRRKRGHPTSGL